MVKPRLLTLLLLSHVVVSIGWFGAAASILAMGVAGLIDPTGAASLAPAIEVVWRSVLVPLSVAALVTGVAQGLATPWGLLRHTWVLTKLILTVAAVLLLLLHTQSLLPALMNAASAGAAVSVEVPAHGHGGLPPRVHLVVAAGGTLLLLLVLASLSFFKPWGRTPFGRPTDAQKPT